MPKYAQKQMTREGYEVGTRPPSDLSEKANRQLQRSRVSPKLMSIVEKARNAKVTRVDGGKHTAGKDPAIAGSTLTGTKQK